MLFNKYKVLILFLAILSCKTNFNLGFSEKGSNEDRAFSAINRGDLELFKLYFKKLEDVNIRDNVGNNFLHIAITLKREEFYDYLISEGVSCSSMNKDGRTPRDLAGDENLKKKLEHANKCHVIIDTIKRVDLTALNYLLKSFDIFNEKDQMGHLVLHKSARFLSVPVIEVIKELDKENQIFLKKDINGNNLLHILALHENFYVLESILKFVEDSMLIQEKNAKDQNFLEFAYENKSFNVINETLRRFHFKWDDKFFEKLFKNSNNEVIETLLICDLKNEFLNSLKKDLEKQSIKSKLTYACEKEYWSLLSYFFSKEQIELEDYKEIIIKGFHTENLILLESLNKLGAKFREIKLEGGNKLIHLSHKSLALMKFMLKIFDLGEKNSISETLVHIIAKNKGIPLDILKYSLSLHFDYERAFDANNKTPLEIAIEEGNEKFLDEFLEARKKSITIEYLKKMINFSTDKNKFKFTSKFVTYAQENQGMKDDE